MHMDLISKIQMSRSALTANEKKACDAIMEDLLLVQHSSLAELSETIGVTKTSILRFCQKLGYSGYSQFKYDLIRFVNENNAQGEDQTPITVVEALYSNAISLIHHSVSDEQMKNLAADIVNARRIYIIGAINSYVSAMQLRYALLMYGIDATVLTGVDDLRAVDMCVQKGDLMILYSVSANAEVLAKMEEMKEQTDCKTALFTMNTSSPFRNMSDHYIVLPKAGTSQSSLLQDIPIVSVFNEILISYLNAVKEN